MEMRTQNTRGTLIQERQRQDTDPDSTPPPSKDRSLNENTNTGGGGWYRQTTGWRARDKFYRVDETQEGTGRTEKGQKKANSKTKNQRPAGECWETKQNKIVSADDPRCIWCGGNIQEVRLGTLQGEAGLQEDGLGPARPESRGSLEQAWTHETQEQLDQGTQGQSDPGTRDLQEQTWN